MTLGERLRMLRERKGLSIRQLSRQAGVPHNTIVRLENGTRTDITTSTAKKLARALGVGVDHLIGMWDEDKRPAGMDLVAT